MPSQAYVAEAIYKLDEDKSWDEATQEEKDACMGIAKIAIAAIQSWQAQHRADGSNRYDFRSTHHDKPLAWEIYDKIEGRNSVLGVVHDSLLAQQIVDDLNRHDTKKMVYRDEKEEAAPE
jgi:hypothetical protein